MRHVNAIPAVFAVVAILVLTVQGASAQFSRTRQFTSNTVIALAGSGDTLWFATEKKFYYQTSIDAAGDWYGSNENYELAAGMLEFGGGMVAAVIYENDGMSFLLFRHEGGGGAEQQKKPFNFPREVRGEHYDLAAPTGGIAFSHGSFWAAFGRGGLVRYDPVNNTVHAITKDGGEVPTENLDTAKCFTLKGDVGVIKGSGGDSLIWAAEDTLPASTIRTYNLASNEWGTIDKKPPNRIYEAIDKTDFSGYLTKNGNTPAITCMLFLPKSAGNDSAGTLAIGTRTGLYICQQAEPLADPPYYGDFSLVNYVRTLKSGENYALPGILRNSADGMYDKCVFVYKLKKDGNVTIKVYDYNMSLVKTAVKGEQRLAGKEWERSTNPARDVWDGTNQGGKRVWPGVYYYKITSTGGDRLFGKVILAK